MKKCNTIGHTINVEFVEVGATENVVLGCGMMSYCVPFSTLFLSFMVRRNMKKDAD
jgi:positive regulator of sigma E activity